VRLWGRRWRTADADPLAQSDRYAHAERRTPDCAPIVEVGHTDTNSSADPLPHAEYAGHNPTVDGGVGVRGGNVGGVGGCVGVGVGVEDSHGYGSIRVEARIQDPGRHHDDGHGHSYGDGDHDHDHDHPGTHTQPHGHVSLTQPADEHDRERDAHDLGHA